MIKQYLENLEKTEQPGQQVAFVVLLGIIGLMLPEGYAIMKNVTDSVQLFQLRAIFILLAYVMLNFMKNLKNIFYISGLAIVIATIFNLKWLIYSSYGLAVLALSCIVAVKVVKVIQGDKSIKEVLQ